MKPETVLRAVWFTLACLSILGLVNIAWSHDQNPIRWTIGGKPLVEITLNGEPKVQFGLRNDGVVVWREITNSTNSPAESERIENNILWNWWTNQPNRLVMTNNAYAQ